VGKWFYEEISVIISNKMNNNRTVHGPVVLLGDGMKCIDCPYNNFKQTGVPYCPLPYCLYDQAEKKKKKDNHDGAKRPAD
jgi:hypothetical protein